MSYDAPSDIGYGTKTAAADTATPVQYDAPADIVAGTTTPVP